MSRTDILDRSGAHDPRAIGNFMLDLCKRAGRPVTIMQLIKLVYFADGWSLTLLGKPLSKHDPQAWQYGPVYPALYTSLKHFGSSMVTEPAMAKGTSLPVNEEFSPAEQEIMQTVVDRYGELSAFQLSQLTHRGGTPWSEAYEKARYSDITADAMKSYFDNLQQVRGNSAFV